MTTKKLSRPELLRSGKILRRFWSNILLNFVEYVYSSLHPLKKLITFLFQLDAERAPDVIFADVEKAIDDCLAAKQGAKAAVAQ